MIWIEPHAVLVLGTYLCLSVAGYMARIRCPLHSPPGQALGLETENLLGAFFLRPARFQPFFSLPQITSSLSSDRSFLKPTWGGRDSEQGNTVVFSHLLIKKLMYKDSAGFLAKRLSSGCLEKGSCNASGELKVKGCVPKAGVGLGRLTHGVFLELGSLSLSFFICGMGEIPALPFQGDFILKSDNSAGKP